MQKPFVVGDFILVEINARDEPVWNYDTPNGDCVSTQICKVIRVDSSNKTFVFEYVLTSGSTHRWIAFNTNNSQYITGMYSLSTSTVSIKEERPFQIGDLIEVDMDETGVPAYSFSKLTSRHTKIAKVEICKVKETNNDSFRFTWGTGKCWSAFQPGHPDYVSGQYRLVTSDTKKKVPSTIHFFQKDCSIEYFAAQYASYDLPFDTWVQEKIKEVKTEAGSFWRRTQSSWPWNRSLEISVNKGTGIFSAYWKDIPDDKLSMK